MSTPHHIFHSAGANSTHPQDPITMDDDIIYDDTVEVGYPLSHTNISGRTGDLLQVGAYEKLSYTVADLPSASDYRTYEPLHHIHTSAPTIYYNVQSYDSPSHTVIAIVD